MQENVINHDATQDKTKHSPTTRMRTGKIADIPRINAIAAAYLGAETLDSSIIASWLAANNEIMRVVECDHNPHTNVREWHLCGYCIVLPLAESIVKLIKKDAIRHADIPPSAMLSYSNPAVSALFFIDFMAHAPICAKKHCGRMTATHLVYDWYIRMQDFPKYYPHITELIAMPVTKESQILVKNLGFLKDDSYVGPQGWELWCIETAKLAQTAKDFTQRIANKRLFSESDET